MQHMEQNILCIGRRLVDSIRAILRIVTLDIGTGFIALIPVFAQALLRELEEAREKEKESRREEQEAKQQAREKERARAKMAAEMAERERARQEGEREKAERRKEEKA